MRHDHGVAEAAPPPIDEPVATPADAADAAPVRKIAIPPDAGPPPIKPKIIEDDGVAEAAPPPIDE